VKGKCANHFATEAPYVELVNDILFDIPSLIGLPRTGNTEAMIRAINHLLYKMRKLSKIIG
jgi:hypothetical protein